MPASADLFRQFPNTVFIETGTFHGYGVEQAIVAGFPIIVSIEASKELYTKAQEKFKEIPNVDLREGDSPVCLKSLLPTIEMQATFWLDAHAVGDGTMPGPEICPCLRELAEIAKHPINTHTILIDDVRLFLSHNFGEITLGSVVETLWSINPRYTIHRTDGEVENDILIAEIL